MGNSATPQHKRGWMAFPKPRIYPVSCASHSSSGSSNMLLAGADIGPSGGKRNIGAKKRWEGKTLGFPSPGRVSHQRLGSAADALIPYGSMPDVPGPLETECFMAFACRHCCSLYKYYSHVCFSRTFAALPTPTG